MYLEMSRYICETYAITEYTKQRVEVLSCRSSSTFGEPRRSSSARRLLVSTWRPGDPFRPSKPGLPSGVTAGGRKSSGCPGSRRTGLTIGGLSAGRTILFFHAGGFYERLDGRSLDICARPPSRTLHVAEVVSVDYTARAGAPLPGGRGGTVFLPTATCSARGIHRRGWCRPGSPAGGTIVLSTSLGGELGSPNAGGGVRSPGSRYALPSVSVVLNRQTDW
jgi:hypothetical protein